MSLTANPAADVSLMPPAFGPGDDRAPASDPQASPSIAEAEPASDRLTPGWINELRWYRRTWLVVALLVLAAYAAFTFRYWDAADDGVDQNAYLLGGRLLAEHGTMKYVLPNPYAYTGSMMVRMPDGVYFPKYPVGLPLLYAMFFWGFRIAAAINHHVNPAQAAYWAFLVSPVSAVAAVWGTFLIARRLAGSFPAVLAAILLGTSQLMISLSANANSHASCTAFAVWGMYALICWQQNGGWWKGAIGGLLIGFAATIRYSEFLLVIPVGLACLGRMRWNQSRTYIGAGGLLAALLAAYLFAENYTGPAYVFAPHFGNRWWFYHDLQYRTLTGVKLLCIAVLCGVLAILRYQSRDYAYLFRNIVPGLAWAVPFGGMLVFNLITMHTATGYDATHESGTGSAFAWKFFWENWEKAVRSLYDVGAFFILPVGVIGIVMLFRRGWTVGLTLVGWLVPGVLLYMFYYWSMDFDVAYARFFLTFIPAIAVGAAVCFKDGILGGDDGPRRWKSVPLTLAAGAVVAIAAGIGVYRAVHGLRDGNHQIAPINEQYAARLNYARTGQVLLDKVPAGSVLFVDDTGFIFKPINYIQFLSNWQVFTDSAFAIEGKQKIQMIGGGRRGRGFGRPNPDEDEQQRANPIQKEQQEYLVGLYRDGSKDQKGKAPSSEQIPLEKLQKMEAELIRTAVADKRRVFVCVGTEPVQDNFQEDGRTKWFTTPRYKDIHPAERFEQNLNHAGRFDYKVIERWEDTSLPPDKTPEQEDQQFPGGNMGRGMMKAFMQSGQHRIWELVEITPAPEAVKQAAGRGWRPDAK